MGETPKIPHGYANLVNGPFLTLYPITLSQETLNMESLYFIGGRVEPVVRRMQVDLVSRSHATLK